MEQYEELRKAIYQTIGDVERWRDVLCLIAEITGIRRGTVALREYETGDVVIPTEVWQTFDGPTLYGWKPEEIDRCINYYMQFDPWIEIERTHHPSKPYVLSQYQDTEQLKNSKFWEWLEPIGIGDGVVVEIGLSPPYWVSMNLFFADDDECAKQKSLSLLTEFQEIMKDAWRLGEIARASHLDEPHLVYFLNQQPEAGLLVDATGLVLLASDKAERWLEDEAIPVFRADGKIRFKSAGLQAKYQQALGCLEKPRNFESSFPEETIHEGNLCVSLALVSPTEDRYGADRGMRLVTLQIQSEGDMEELLPVWENPILTKRERQLVKLLAEGGRVVDYMNQYGLTKSTAHFHWQNVKKKLDIKDRAEIVAKYQKQSQNL